MGHSGPNNENNSTNESITEKHSGQPATLPRRYGTAINPPSAHYGAGGRDRAGRSDVLPLTPEECDSLLQILDATSRIRRHFELFQLLQGVVQKFIPHEILVSSWGDLRATELKVDVASPLPNVRTGKIRGCTEPLLRAMFARWVNNGRGYVLIEGEEARAATDSTCGCPLHMAMRRMNHLLVHGVHGERDNIDSIYIAMHTTSITAGRSVDNFSALIDPLIAHIDAAYRKVAPLKIPPLLIGEQSLRKSARLSAREREIMAWISEGKTNMQIADIVGISSFTVKNHVQRIFRKLGATNRTEAVAKLRNNDRPAAGSHAPHLEMMALK